MNNEVEVSHAIIPAQPGWFVARLIPKRDLSESYFEYASIVAWEIEPGIEVGDGALGAWRLALPITTTGDFLGPYAIKGPDGKFNMYGRVLDNEAEVIEAITEAIQEDRKELQATSNEPERAA